MVNEHSNQPESQTSDSTPTGNTASAPANGPSPSVPDANPGAKVTQPTEALSSVPANETMEPEESDGAEKDKTDSMMDNPSESVTVSSSVADTPVTEITAESVTVVAESSVPQPSASNDSATSDDAELDDAELDDAEPDDAEPDDSASNDPGSDNSWDDEPIASRTNSSSPQPSPTTKNAGTKAKAIAAITLTTIIQGAKTATTSLESIKLGTSTNTEPSSVWATGWEIVQSVLIAIGLTSIRWAKLASNWVLARVDADSHAAVKAGTAPFLRDRLQSTPFGAKCLNLLDRGWAVWTRGLNIFRRILPTPLKTWANPGLTVFLLLTAVVLIRVTAAISPRIASVNTTVMVAEPTITAAPTAQPLLFGQDLENDPRDQSLAANLEKRFVKVLFDRYDGVIQRVVINREHDRILLVLEQTWYDLTQSDQQQLAALLAKTAIQNEFDHLTLVDLAGVRVGRSPVVGKDMILYQTVRPMIEVPVVETPVEDLPIEDVVIEKKPAGDIVEDTQVEEDAISTEFDTAEDSGELEMMSTRETTGELATDDSLTP